MWLFVDFYPRQFTEINQSSFRTHLTHMLSDENHQTATSGVRPFSGVQPFMKRPIKCWGVIAALLIAAIPALSQEKDTQTVLEFVQAAAQKGDVQAQIIMAKSYATGDDFDSMSNDQKKEVVYGAEKNPAKAFAWWEKAAAQGNKIAMLSVANYCALGMGVAKDYPKAISLYKKLAADGNQTAKEQLAIFRMVADADPFHSYSESERAVIKKALEDSRVTK